MIVVVEIASGSGSIASKEYDSPSMKAAVRAAERELQRYPGFTVVDVWVKGEPRDFGASDAW